MSEDMKAWMDKLEKERAHLEALKAEGSFTEEQAARLLNIEALLAQVDVNQNLRSSQS